MHTCILVFDLTLRNRGTNFLRAQLSGWRKRRNKTLIFIVVKERSKYSVILFFFSFFHLRILLCFFLIYLGFFQTILHFCVSDLLLPYLTENLYLFPVDISFDKIATWMLLWYVICRYQSIRFVNIVRTLWRFYAAFSKMVILNYPWCIQSTKTNVKFCDGKAEYTRIFR